MAVVRHAEHGKHLVVTFPNDARDVSVNALAVFLRNEVLSPANCEDELDMQLGVRTGHVKSFATQFIAVGGKGRPFGATLSS